MANEIERILVLAPSVVKKGETAKILIGTRLGLLEMWFGMVDPDGIVIQPKFKDVGKIAYPVTYYGSATGTIGIPLGEMTFTFSKLGTYYVYVTGTEAGATPASLEGGAHITCAAWATNMDVPVSNIDKQTTNISRLRTVFNNDSNKIL